MTSPGSTSALIARKLGMTTGRPASIKNGHIQVGEGQQECLGCAHMQYTCTGPGRLLVCTDHNQLTAR